MERFATGAWLDRSMVRFVACTTLAGIATVIAFGLLTRTGPHGTLDAWGRPLGTDFTLVWSTGRMALDGKAAQIYDWASLHRAEQAAHGSEAIPFFGWHYPPFFILIAAALAPLPYLVALVVWQATTLAAALAVVWRILPGRDTLLAALGFPAAFVCLTHGHNAFLTASLFGGGLLLLDRRPILAGCLLGCLAYKPQFGLIVPLALLAGGYLRPIGAAAATVAVLAAATLTAFGTGPWAGFFETLDLTRTIVLEEGGTGWYKIQSVFSYVRMLGGPVALAYAVQGTATALVVAATTWIWRIRADPRLRGAALMIGALLATPYVLDYDMVLLGPAIAMVAGYGIENGFRRWERTALAFAWFVPVATRQLAFFGHVPGGLLAMAMLFVLVAGRALRTGGFDRRRHAPTSLTPRRR